MQLEHDGKQPLVSVIVPVYMIEKYVDRCISSIRQQTYNNLEIIIINDGSIDNSIQICNRHAKEDGRIVVINQENKGLSAARNEGIRLAHGKYLTFVDGDDWIESEMINKLVDAVEQNNAQICCCGHSRESGVVAELFTPRKESLTGKAAVGEWLRNRNIKMMAWGKLYSRDLFRENAFFPEGKYFEDTASCWKLFNRSQKVVVISEILYHYCIRGESISNSHSISNIIDKWYAFHSLYNSVGTHNKEFEKLTMRMCFSCVEYAWHERLKYSKDEWLMMDGVYKEMAAFSREHFKECRECGCNLLERMCIFFACTNTTISFYICSIVHGVYRAIMAHSSNGTSRVA